MEDTIAAISTPIGQGGIAIVRLSGLRVIEIADKLFVSKHGKPSQFSSHTIHYGTISGGGDIVDEVMLSIMRAPHTYTKENVIEINCHGGSYTANKILSLCLNHGARIAEPGEFTKRAFLNGRIDLTQAEAVMGVILSRTERAHASAEYALAGHLFNKIENLRQELITILAHLEAHIDFPDEDIQPDTHQKLENDLARIIILLKQLVLTAHEGKILREGVSIAIIGRPNVGKSSIMNALLGSDRSIVTCQAGTTRDTIEEAANIRGIPVRFIDTAGIRKPRGKIEESGISRSYNTLLNSDIRIHILDLSRSLSTFDIELIELCKNKNSIRVFNKVDCNHRLKLPKYLCEAEILETSATTGYGIEQLKDTIERHILGKKILPVDNSLTINERHEFALKRAIHELQCALNELKVKMTLEVISQRVRIGLDSIGEITGKTTTEDLLDKIFNTFCIGK